MSVTSSRCAPHACLVAAHGSGSRGGCSGWHSRSLLAAAVHTHRHSCSRKLLVALLCVWLVVVCFLAGQSGHVNQDTSTKTPVSVSLGVCVTPSTSTSVPTAGASASDTAGQHLTHSHKVVLCDLFWMWPVDVLAALDTADMSVPGGASAPYKACQYLGRGVWSHRLQSS